MGKEKQKIISSANLRTRAEDILNKSGDLGEILTLSHGEMGSLIHELRVRQEEISIQNEALREKQIEIEESRGKYMKNILICMSSRP